MISLSCLFLHSYFLPNFSIWMFNCFYLWFMLLYDIVCNCVYATDLDTLSREICSFLQNSQFITDQVYTAVLQNSSRKRIFASCLWTCDAKYTIRTTMQPMTNSFFTIKVQYSSKKKVIYFKHFLCHKSI